MKVELRLFWGERRRLMGKNNGRQGKKGGLGRRYSNENNIIKPITINNEHMPIKQESKERQRQSNKPKKQEEKANSELVGLGWGQDFFWLCSTDNTE